MGLGELDGHILPSSASNYTHPEKVKERVKAEPPQVKFPIKPSLAKAPPWKVSEKPKELLSVIKRQGWLPQEGSVRRILCADPSCDICNDVALEIQQLLEDVHKSTSKTSLGLSRTSSCPNIVSTSSLFLPKAVSFSGKVTTVSQVATKNPATQFNAQSSCAGSIHDIWTANHQPKQEFQVTDLFQDKAIYSSSAPEEPGIPVNQKDKRKSNTKHIQEKKESAEAGKKKKMKDVPHPKINPKVKSLGLKDSHFLSKKDLVTKPTTKTSEKELTPTKSMIEVKLEKTKDTESLEFFDASQSTHKRQELLHKKAPTDKRRAKLPKPLHLPENTRHKKVKKKERCATSKGRRHFREDNEKLLSVIKSQGWLPQEGSVRRLLCADPSCDICNNVALDIHQLLTGEQMLTSQNALRPSQSSARLEIMSKSTITFEQSPEDHFVSHSEELTLSSAVPVESHIKHQNSFTQLCVRSPSALSIQDYWSDCDQVTQKFQVTEVGYDPETRFSSEPKESEISACQQEAMMKATDISENQKQEVENSAISVYIPLTVNQDITAKALTHPMSLHMVAAHPNYPPNLSPEVLRLLEMHVKKWMHFQRWGLPRRVEESMRQFMPHPPTFFQSKNNQSVSFMQEETAGFSVENFGGISYKTWGSCMAGQPTQAFWVSEWSIIDQAHKYHYQQIQNHLAVVLHSPTFKDLSGKKMNNPVNHLQQKYRQLFCGLPSLHSESLVVNILDSQGFSLNETMSKLPIKDPFILQELSILPLPPKTPPKSSEPSPHSSSNEVNPSDNQPPQINVPFLTLAECEDLEWHVLQKQLQLQWGLPAIFQRSQRVPSPILCRPYDKTQSPEMVKTSWAEKHNSVLPEHSRRPLDFHFQRQLSQHRWGLPSKIQQSIQLVLSHNDQQTLSLRSTGADTNVGISQPTDQEATLAGESFTKLMNTELVHMPHLFAQAKAMLQSHIHSKCGQILQGNVPAYVYSSQGCMIPESVQVAPFTCNPESQTLELQASAGLDSQDKVIPWMPMTLDQEQQDPSAIVTEQPTLPQILSEGAIEKLETTLKHKYMTLSELPALYCVALSRAVSPENTTQAITTNMVDKPVESLAAESQIQMISSEAQMKKEIVPVIPEKESEPESPISTKKPILNKLKFHLKKKVLETQLGIPIKARKSRELILAIPEKITTQESLENLNKQEEALPRDFSIPSDITCGPDPEQIYHKKQLGVELIAMQKNQKQPLSCTVSHDSGQWVSKIPQPTSDMTAAQVLCVQLENNVSTPNLDEAWDHEPHSSSKRKDSTQIPTLTEKREDLGRHKNVGNQGEGDAGFVLASIKGSLPAEGQCQKRTLLNKTLHSHQHRSHQHSRQTMQNASHQPSRQDCPQLMLLKQTLGTHNENKGEKSSLRGSQAKISAIHKPARIPQYAQSVRSQMSQDQSFLGQPALRKPLQGQTLQHRFLQGQRMPVPAHKSSSLPESGLRNKMKSFLHCISPKTKDKRYHESMLSITEKVIRKELVQKNPASVKSPMEQTKREKTSENPMTQCTPTKKQVGVPSLPGPQSSENKLRHRSCSHQQHSESVLGPPRHCPRHCPRMAFVTQLRNPP